MSEVLLGKEVATLAGGCFWCLEAVYDQLRGIDDVVSGYAGGRVRNPSYQAVCAGTTGHAEVVQVTFDPAVVSFREILEVFFTVHDPPAGRRGTQSSDFAQRTESDAEQYPEIDPNCRADCDRGAPSEFYLRRLS